MAATEDTRTSGRGDSVESPWITPVGVLVLVVLGGVLPLTLAVAWGSLGVPHNDDWAYLRALGQFADHGSADAQNWAGMSLFGQILLFAPLSRLTGNSLAAVQVGVALVGVMGLIALVAAGVGLGLSRQRALFVACVVAVTPLWAPLSVSFMTDIPAFAFATLALALGVWALRSGTVSLRLLVASVVIGLFAFTIREYFLVVPVGLLITCRVVMARSGATPPKTSGTYHALVALSIMGVASFMLWRVGVPGGGNTVTITGPTALDESLIKCCRAIPVFGLLVFPVVLLQRPSQTVRRAWSANRRMTVAVLVGTFVAWLNAVRPWGEFETTLLVGNYLSSLGTLGLSPMGPDRSDLIPPFLVVTASLLGATAAAFAVLCVLPGLCRVGLRPSRLAAWDPKILFVGIVVIAYSAGLLLLTCMGAALWDRYIQFSAALGALLVARAIPSPPAVRRAVSHLSLAALGLLGLLGLVYATDSAAFDGARWRFATTLTERYEPTQIGGGFEWQGWYGGASRALRFDGYCVVVQNDVGQGAPDDPRWTVRSLTRETRLVAIRDPACPAQP